MYNTILDEHRQKLLHEISDLLQGSGFYLAGGTGLSLVRGYRNSVDFDFFKQTSFNEQSIMQRLQECYRDSIVLDLSNGTCDMQIENVQVSLFHYPYPLLEKISGSPEYPNLVIAGPKDIACMKMEAIAQRGAKKDFYDLDCIRKDFGYSAADLLDAYRQKYGKNEQMLRPVIMGLSYFEDAETQKLPHTYMRMEWGDIKKDSIQLSQELEQELINEREIDRTDDFEL